jgi:GH15 family glucan-1,4-alpha-glucosidase
MHAEIGDYALLGDTQTAALVSRNGSVDWLCLPRFDSAACFATIVGGAEHGRWLLAPTAPAASARRHYRGDTLVLETDYEGTDGAVTVVDAMPPPDGRGVTLVRLVIGRGGRMPMCMEFAPRFGYGRHTPVLERSGRGLLAISGPDALRLSTPAKLINHGGTARASFTVTGQQRVPFTLTWFRSHQPPPPQPAPEDLLADCERYWRTWAERCTYQGPWRPAVIRSLLTLKALTYAPTGGMIAAPTTSLPEAIGGTRNWDYRYCWLRDAALTLTALHNTGYTQEALAWRAWLLGAAAGDPAGLQIVYGPAGERHLPEWEASWLPGHHASAPVRIGNAAASQFQLDVYGEIADSQYALVLEAGFEPGQQQAIRQMLEFLEQAWPEPDEGIWEIRGPRRHFTYSKVMAWAAFDRALKLAEVADLDGPTRRWRAVRDQIHAEVCRNGFDPVRKAFVQSYGSPELDASLLRLPAVGFLPATDPRITGTVTAIGRELSAGDGLLLRYSAQAQGEVDGLNGGEGTFLACSFWLADCLAAAGHRERATDLFERLLALRNDVGLLAEQYDPARQQLIGNFPQAISHLALVNTALLLSRQEAAAAGRTRSPRGHRE